jgi:hypothetical protein
MISFRRPQIPAVYRRYSFSTQGLNHPGAMIVSPAEPTAKGQDLKIVQSTSPAIRALMWPAGPAPASSKA